MSVPTLPVRSSSCSSSHQDLAFPQGSVLVTSDYFSSLAQDVFSEAVTSAKEALDHGWLPRFFTGLFQNRDALMNAGLSFKEGEIPVKGLAPDIDIDQNASVSTLAGITRGAVYLGSPIYLDGFGAIFPNDISRLEITDEGRVKLYLCWFPFGFDITDKLFEGSHVTADLLKTIFPSKRVEPIKLDQLFEAIPISSQKLPASEKGTDFSKALQRGFLNFIISSFGLMREYGDAHGNYSMPIDGAGSILVRFPTILELFTQLTTKKFDLQGVEEGTFVEWTWFPLASIPWPEGFPIVLEGVTDLRGVVHSKNNGWEMALSAMDMTLKIPGLWGDQKMGIKGSLVLEGSTDGRALLHLKDFTIHWPKTSNDSHLGLNFDIKISGLVALNLKAQGQNMVEGAELSIEVNDFLTFQGMAIQLGSDGAMVGTSLRGRVDLNYDLFHAQTPFSMSWHLKGDALVEAKDHQIELNNFEFQGFQGFRDFKPVLEHSNYDLNTDATVTKDCQPVARADRLRLKFTPQGPERSILRIHADSVSAYGQSFVPDAKFTIRYQEQKKGVKLNFTGPVSLRQGRDTHFLAGLTGKTNFKNWEITGQLGRQVFKDYLADGSAFFEASPNGFSLETTVPYEVIKDYETVATGLKLSGRLNHGEIEGGFQVDSIFDRVSAKIDLPQQLFSNRLNGQYDLALLNPVKVGENLNIDTGDIKGGLELPFFFGGRPLREIKLLGEMHATLHGQATGPFAAQFSGGFRWGSLSSLQDLEFYLEGSVPSKIGFGPLELSESDKALWGDIEAKGTLALRTAKNGKRVLVAKDIALKNGEVFLKNNGIVHENPPGYGIPLFDNLHLTSRLLTFEEGVMVAPHFLRFETDIHPAAIGKPIIDPDAHRFHLIAATDRQFFNPLGYWKMLGDMVTRVQAASMKDQLPTSSPWVSKNNDEGPENSPSLEPLALALTSSATRPISPDIHPAQTPIAKLVFEWMAQLKNFTLNTEVQLPFTKPGSNEVIHSKTRIVIKDRGVLDQAHLSMEPGFGPIPLLPPLHHIPVLSPFFKARLLEVRMDPEDRRLDAKICYLVFPFTLLAHDRIMEKIPLPPELLQGPDYDLRKAVPMYSWQLVEILEKAFQEKQGEATKQVSKQIQESGVTPRWEAATLFISGDFSNEQFTTHGITAKFDPLDEGQHRFMAVGQLIEPFVSIKGLQAAEVETPRGKFKIYNEDGASGDLSVTLSLDPKTLKAKELNLMTYKSKKISVEVISKDDPNLKNQLDLAQGIDLWGLRLNLREENPEVTINQVVAKQILFRGYGTKMRSTAGDETILRDVRMSIVDGKPRFYAKVKGRMRGDINYFPEKEEIGRMHFKWVQGEGEILVEPDVAMGGITRVAVVGQLEAQMNQLMLLVKNEKIAAHGRTEIEDAEIKGYGQLYVWPEKAKVMVESAESANPILVRGKKGRVVFHQATSQVRGWEELGKHLGKKAALVESNAFIDLSHIQFSTARLDLQSFKQKGSGRPALEITEAEIGPVEIRGDIWGTLYVRLPGGYYFPVEIKEDAKMKEAFIQIKNIKDRKETGGRRIDFSDIVINAVEERATFSKEEQVLCANTDRQHVHAQIGFFWFKPDQGELSFEDVDPHFHLNLKNGLGGRGCILLHQVHPSLHDSQGP